MWIVCTDIHMECQNLFYQKNNNNNNKHKLFPIKILVSKCQCDLENEVQVTKI